MNKTQKYCILNSKDKFRLRVCYFYNIYGSVIWVKGQKLSRIISCCWWQTECSYKKDKEVIRCANLNNNSMEKLKN